MISLFSITVLKSKDSANYPYIHHFLWHSRWYMSNPYYSEINHQFYELYIFLLLSIVLDLWKFFLSWFIWFIIECMCTLERKKERERNTRPFPPASCSLWYWTCTHRLDMFSDWPEDPNLWLAMWLPPLSCSLLNCTTRQGLQLAFLRQLMILVKSGKSGKKKRKRRTSSYKAKGWN